MTNNDEKIIFHFIFHNRAVKSLRKKSVLFQTNGCSGCVDCNCVAVGILKELSGFVFLTLGTETPDLPEALESVSNQVGIMTQEIYAWSNEAWPS
jgi:hypothetical protein